MGRNRGGGGRSPSLKTEGSRGSSSTNTGANNISLQGESGTIYKGDRVNMKVTSDGEVSFTVDGAISLNERGNSAPPPTREMITMSKSFDKLLGTKEGKRIFYNVPVTNDGLGETRAKLYAKRGFETVTIGEGKDKFTVQILNNTGKKISMKKAAEAIRVSREKRDEDLSDLFM